MERDFLGHSRDTGNTRTHARYWRGASSMGTPVDGGHWSPWLSLGCLDKLHPRSSVLLMMDQKRRERALLNSMVKPSSTWVEWHTWYQTMKSYLYLGGFHLWKGEGLAGTTWNNSTAKYKVPYTQIRRSSCFSVWRPRSWSPLQTRAAGFWTVRTDTQDKPRTISEYREKHEPEPKTG